MNIVSVELFQYAIPFVEELRIKDRQLVTRSGLIVKLVGDDGAVGYGDMAPLSGNSPETLEQAAQDAAVLADALAGQTIPEGIEALTGGFEQWLTGRVSSPSARFGFELAVLNLLAKSRGVSLRKLIDPDAPDQVMVAGLLNGNLGEIRKKAEYLKNEGYRAVKLKVGRYSLEDDIRTTLWLREHLGESVSLRLDGNRAWDLDTAIAYAREVTKCFIEFIEEPLADPTKLNEFTAALGTRVALDEALLNMPVEELNAMSHLAAVILKPTVLGLERSVRFGRRAQEIGVIPVLSSSFETGLGLCALAELAAVIQPDGVPAGLDTYEWLDDDVLTERAPLRKPCLDLNELASSCTVAEHMLQKLPRG